MYQLTWQEIVCSALDANSGYFQIEIKDTDKGKNAFISHHGYNRFIRKIFGLQNAPGTFQRTMDVVLSSVKWKINFVHIDSFAIFSNTLK